MHSLFARCAAILVALLAVSPVCAQNYPAKPVRIMVGAPPGGGTDIIARMLADKFSEAFKQSFVVENKPGASNTIAADITAKAAPDGYTLLAATNTGQAIAPHLLKLGYDPLKGLQPVGLIVVVPNVLVVADSVPAKDVRELVALMKAKPAEFQYASSGIGSTQHIAGIGFATVTGTSPVHVPYKGSSQAHADLITGRVQMMLDTTSSAMPQIKAGKLRPIGIVGPRRVAALPDVPTLAEEGLLGVDAAVWFALVAPANTPAEVVARLNREVVKAVDDAAMKARFSAMAMELGSSSPQDVVDLTNRERSKWAAVVRKHGIKVE